MGRVVEEIKSLNTCVLFGTIESLHLKNLSKHEERDSQTYISSVLLTWFESFVSFSMIGTGFSADQIKEFGRFFQNTQKYNSKNLPSWLSHPEKSTEVPDVIVKDVRDTVVIEVKASEIVFSRK
jgi:ATP-dependent DNA ligase